MILNNLLLYLLILSNFLKIYGKHRSGVDPMYLNIPRDLEFGVTTSAYQIEGAWNKGRKSENIWDEFTHKNSQLILDNSNADVTCDSYHKFNEDIKNLVWLGVNFYSFSISWTRILPNAFSGVINSEGVKYYDRLIEGLVANNIHPMVTLYYWDLPQSMQNIGGWTNEITVGYFVNYADTCFRIFGDRVKTWITFSGPFEICHEGYGTGNVAPGIKSPGIGEYLCGKHILLSHAIAYRLYNKVYKPYQHGKIGIAINAFWFQPHTKTWADRNAADRSLKMTIGWWINPISSADYPNIMKRRIEESNEHLCFNYTRLPHFTSKEKRLLKGAYDFIGINHYTSYMVSANTARKNWTLPSFEGDLNVTLFFDSKWKKSCSPRYKNVPWGLRKLLNWIKDEYGNPPIYITENGFPERCQMGDFHRINYIKGYLAAVLDSIKRDHCNVQKYSIWTLMDNFHWLEGYTLRFGLFYTQLQFDNSLRTPKDSAQFYKSIIQRRQFSLDPTTICVYRRCIKSNRGWNSSDY